MAKYQVTVPDIGSSDPVDVIELLVAVGDKVAVDDSLLVLESEKASVEMPSPVAGKVTQWLVALGASVNTGDVVLELEVAAEESASADTAEVVDKAVAGEQPVSVAPAPTQADTPAAVPAGDAVVAPRQVEAEPVQTAGTLPAVHAGPAVRKLARQMGIDLAHLPTGSGTNGRLVKEDVFEFVRQGAGKTASVPEVDFSQFGEVERQPLSTLRQTAARHLQQGWQVIPQVTQHELTDITELEAFRRAENARHPEVKLTLLAFVARAVVGALQVFPQFNSSLTASGNELIIKHYCHLGFAVDTEHGLLVPVLKDADRLGVRAIAQSVAGLAEQARNRKLQPRDMQGASFTITSLGGIGGTAFTPLVNSPQVAILGISRADWQPVWQPDSQTFVPRLMLPLSLSYDHRVIDGADAARFVVHLAASLSDLRRLLL